MSTAHDGDHFNELETQTKTFSTDYTLKDSYGINTRDYIVNYGSKPITKTGSIWDASNEKTPAGAQWAVERATEYWDWTWGQRLRGGINIYVNVTSFNTPNAEVYPTLKYGYDMDLSPDNWLTSLASLKILSHEFTHLIDYEHAYLGFNSLDSDASAINEGFADIGGVATKKWYYGGSPEWDMFDELPDRHRYFDDPTKDYQDLTPTNAPTPSPEFYADPYWNTGDPHRRMGIQRKWFYLLCNGGTVSTPHNGTISIPAIGFDKAMKIAGTTLLWWCWSNMDYNDLHKQTLNVAEYYYGKCSFEERSVHQAWKAVEIGGASLSCPLSHIIRAPFVANMHDVDQYNPSMFKIRLESTDGSPLPDAGDITWNIPAEWHTTTNVDNTEVTLEYVDDLASREISANVYSGGNTYTLTHVIHFVDCNDCGCMPPESMYKAKIEERRIITDGIVVYPNPVSTFVNISIPGGTGQIHLDLYDIAGRKVFSTTINDGSNHIQLPALTSGIYLVKMKNDKLSSIKYIQLN